MCLICASIDENKLSPLEAWKNLSEMYGGMTQEHVADVLSKIAEMEAEEEVEIISGEAEPSEDFPFVNWDWGSD